MAGNNHSNVSAEAFAWYGTKTGPLHSAMIHSLLTNVIHTMLTISSRVILILRRGAFIYYVFKGVLEVFRTTPHPYVRTVLLLT